MIDANGNGKIDITDVHWIFKNYDDPLVQWLSHTYDFNGDGSVNIVDVQEALKTYRNYPKGEEITVDVYQSKPLSEHFGNGPLDKMNGAKVAKRYIKHTYNSIPGKQVNVRIQGTVDIDLSENYSEDLDHWEDYLEDDQIPEDKTDSQILLATERESVGGVARFSEPEASICYSCDFLFHARDPISPAGRADWINGTAMNIVHEVGHNFGLSHLDGAAKVINGSKFVPDGMVVGTPMVGLYLAMGSYRGEKNNAGDTLPDLPSRSDYYLTPHLSAYSMELLADAEQLPQEERK